MTQPNTHLAIDTDLCGLPTLLEEGRAQVLLQADERMSADARGLIHGGFVFGAVDYAAMLAINDPNVVLGSAEVRFLAPVRRGDSVLCEAKLRESAGKRRVLAVVATVAGREVLRGTLTAFVLDHHVLEGA